MRKKPRKPKQGASLTAWENYDRKITSWMKDKKRLESLKSKHR